MPGKSQDTFHNKTIKVNHVLTKPGSKVVIVLKQILNYNCIIHAVKCVGGRIK